MVNLALYRPTNQSSETNEGPSNRAVDGYNDQNFAGKSCTFTDKDQQNTWWSVQLKHPSNITEIAMTNRGDCCDSEFRAPAWCFGFYLTI